MQPIGRQRCSCVWCRICTFCDMDSSKNKCINTETGPEWSSVRFGAVSASEYICFFCIFIFSTRLHTRSFNVTLKIHAYTRALLSLHLSSSSIIYSLIFVCLPACLLIFIHPFAQPVHCTTYTLMYCWLSAVGRVSVAMFVASVTLYYTCSVFSVHICILYAQLEIQSVTQASKQPSKCIQSDEFILFSSFHISLAI